MVALHKKKERECDSSFTTVQFRHKLFFEFYYQLDCGVRQKEPQNIHTYTHGPKISKMALHEYFSCLMAEMHTSASEVSIVSDNSHPSPTARKKAQVRIVALARQGSIKRRHGRSCPVKRWESDSSLDFDDDGCDVDYDVETEYDLECSPTTRRSAAGTRRSRAAKMSMMRKSKSDTSISMPLRTVSPRIIKKSYCPVVIESPNDNNNNSPSASQNATWGMMRQTSTCKMGSMLPTMPTRRGSLTSSTAPVASAAGCFESSPELHTMKMKHTSHGHLGSNSTSSSSKMSSLRNALGSMAPTINKNNKNSKNKLTSSSLLLQAGGASSSMMMNSSLILSPNSFSNMAGSKNNVGNSSMTSVTSSTSVSLSPNTAFYGSGMPSMVGRGIGVAPGLRLPFDTRNLQEDSLDFLSIEFE